MVVVIVTRLLEANARHPLLTRVVKQRVIAVAPREGLQKWRA
jgi:hypothetical protein